MQFSTQVMAQRLILVFVLFLLPHGVGRSGSAGTEIPLALLREIGSPLEELNAPVWNRSLSELSAKGSAGSGYVMRQKKEV